MKFAGRKVITSPVKKNGRCTLALRKTHTVILRHSFQAWSTHRISASEKELYFICYRLRLLQQSVEKAKK